MKVLIAALAIALVSTPVAASAPDEITQSQRVQVDQAIDLIHDGRPADAIKQLDEVIAANDARYRDLGRDIYCTRTTTEAVLYMGMSGAAKRDAVAIDPTWCDAIFYKGFALIDVGRPAEARKWLERAVAMAPNNAHYGNELAESYKTERNWEKAYALFEKAAGDARTFSPDNRKSAELGRALRGMGFVRIETGQLDEAQKYFEDSLKIDPNNPNARSELQYIAEQRALRTTN